MLEFKPVTELGNEALLERVEYGKPVVLTEDDLPEYVVMEFDEYFSMQRKLLLLRALADDNVSVIDVPKMVASVLNCDADDDDGLPFA